MIEVNSYESAAAAFGLGVALHLLLFIRGEWDLQTINILGGFFGLEAVFTWFLMYTTDMSVLSAITATVVLGTCVVTGLVTSMLIYRGFFHRLHNFPGPFLARFSNLYISSLATKQLHLHEEMQKLHEKYGDYVRVGPTELSIADPQSLQIMLGSNSVCTKGPWYTVLDPMVSLHVERDPVTHARRRKVWDKGFSAKSLREYEPTIAKYTDQLMAHLKLTAGQPVNVTDWFNFYSFDIMGVMAFGKSFNMLEQGKKHYFMSSLHKFMEGIGLFSHALWLFPIVKATPGLNSESLVFWKWVNAQVEGRKQMKPDSSDVMTGLLNEYNSQPKSKRNDLNLVGDAYTLCVAGSDTTAATLTCLFYLLALNPSVVKTLQAEVDEYFNGGVYDAITLAKLKYLDAVINEGLRMHPAVPSGVQRLTPPEGLRIGDKFIPGDSIIQNPFYAMFRDERNFVDPNKFIPERWTTRPELSKDPSVSIPFSIGKYSCIGKQLALMELRYVTSQIVHEYDISLAPGEDANKFMEGQVDAFTLACPDLNLVFTPRAHG